MVMIDMHTHFLPDVDDGCRNIEESLYLLRQCKKNGVDTVYLTPHINHPKYPNTKSHILKVYDNMKSQLEMFGIQTYIGSEIYLTPTLDFDNIIPLGNTRYILVETSFNVFPVYLNEMIFKLQLSDYKVILAHVERFSWLIKNEELQHDLKAKDVKFQVNYDSLTSKKHRHQIKKWLSKRWIEFIGSDKHRKDDGRSLMKFTPNLEKFNQDLEE